MIHSTHYYISINFLTSSELGAALCSGTSFNLYCFVTHAPCYDLVMPSLNSLEWEPLELQQNRTNGKFPRLIVLVTVSSSFLKHWLI